MCGLRYLAYTRLLNMAVFLLCLLMEGKITMMALPFSKHFSQSKLCAVGKHPQ
jgi:hypothetical protein